MDADATRAAEPTEIVIQGVTTAGRPFRPSDWSERLCGMMSVFSEDRHLSYSPYLKPVISGGLSCVVVDRKLETLDPPAFQFLMDFAQDNELCMRPGRSPAPPSNPVLENIERRVVEPTQGAAT